MLPIAPGQSATVLVALAVIAGTPSPTNAGKVISVPPPAMELIAPPMAAASTTQISLDSSMPTKPQGVTGRGMGGVLRAADRTGNKRYVIPGGNMTARDRVLTSMRPYAFATRLTTEQYA